MHETYPLRIRVGAAGVAIATLALVVLRLTGVIGWPWWVVLSPAWASLLFAFLVLAAFFLAVWMSKRNP